MIILTVIISCILLYILWTRRALYKLSWRLNGPPAYPFFGNLFSVWNPKNNVVFMDHLVKYQKLARLWMGPKLYLFIHDANIAETILRSKSCLRKPEEYDTVRDVLGGDGLFTSSGDVWKQHRKLLKPSLKDSTVADHVTVFNYYFRQFCKDTLSQEVDGKPFDVLIPINVCFLETYLHLTFGQKWQHKSRYAELFKTTIEIASTRVYRPWLKSKFIRIITGYEKRIRIFRDFSNQAIFRLIEQSLEEKSCTDSFVDKLLAIQKANENFSLDDVRAESHNLLVAAGDTTGVAMASSVLMLAIHPNCQEKVYQELLDANISAENDITLKQLNSLNYMEKCIKEAMRLFPTVPVIGRVTTEPIILDGVEIPADIPLIIGIRQIQRKEEYWGDNANDFRPERFDNNTHEHNAYLVFSLGLRNCIGMNYAMVSMKLCLAHILLNYHITSPLKLEELKVRMSISFRFLSKTLVQLHKRK